MRTIKKSQVDNQIEVKYDKARIALNLVNQYDASLLDEISTIADLSSGSYGLYNSGENSHLIPEDVKQQIRLIFHNENMDDAMMSRIPVKVLSERFPQIDANSIQIDNVIRVNVSRIVNESNTDLEAVLEIASTIVHEATHEIEFESQGWTSEAGPQAAERNFYSWAMQNIQMIKSIPELQDQQIEVDNQQQMMQYPNYQQQMGVAANNFKTVFEVKGY